MRAHRRHRAERTIGPRVAFCWSRLAPCRSVCFLHWEQTAYQHYHYDFSILAFVAMQRLEAATPAIIKVSLRQRGVESPHRSRLQRTEGSLQLHPLNQVTDTS